ncbi:MAG TPA: hypothetical protein VIK89_06950 [Cytophagaceae bacterium]
MLEKLSQVLHKVREGQIALSEFLYNESTDKEGKLFDVNAVKRYRLLVALQYDLQSKDEQLIKELLAAEIQMHRKAFHDMAPSLSLNAYLLSQFRKPEYALLFLKAKQANYETNCSLDFQYLVSAGIKNTYEFLEGMDSPEIENFYSYMGDTAETCFLSEVELEEWRREQKDYFSKKYSGNSFKAEIQLALELDDKEVAVEKVNEWQNFQEVWGVAELKELNYYRVLLEDYQGQVWANEELLKQMVEDSDKVYTLQFLSSLYLKLNDPINAWEKIKQSLIHLQELPEDTNTKRFLVENAFDVVLQINNASDVIAQEAYSWVTSSINTMHSIHHNLLKKIAEAGKLMNDTEVRNKYKSRLKEEQIKLDSILYQAELLKKENLNDTMDLWEMDL